MKKNIEMIVVRKFKQEPIEGSDIISNDIIYDEFKYKYIGVPIKYIYEYIQDLYSNMHIYIIYICLILLFFIFIQNHLFIKNIKINNT